MLIDRIASLEPGRRIEACKALSLAEEYLADHFPTFPVLPGVFMLEAMVQASAWLVRASLDFAPSVVLLKEARNVTYKSFLAPGQLLTVESNCKEMQADRSVFAASGRVGEREIVRGTLTLRHMTLAERTPEMAEVDAALRTELRRQFALLGGDRLRPAEAAV